MVKITYYIFLIGFLFSCGQEEKQPMENPTQIEKYFLLKDFVENQINRLDGARVRKYTRIKGEEEHTELKFNAEDWRKELHIFIQADINKANLATSYDTEEDSNLTIHRLKPGEKSPIQEIKINYQDNQVSRISFISHQENTFYTSGSEGELILDTASGKLSSYYVSGMQKVWFISSNEMEIRGELLQ